MTKKRPLTSEEKLLWKQVTKSVKRFKPQEISLQTEGEEIQPSQPASTTVLTSFARNDEIKAPKKNKPLKKGDYTDIDKNTAERFRKGEAIIDARLDLHGMTTEKAHKSLISFINKQEKLENRRLLVITGKGSGILRSSLPDWLAAPSISGSILAFDTAQTKHGGTGAYYILLKRKRQSNDP